MTREEEIEKDLVTIEQLKVRIEAVRKSLPGLDSDYEGVRVFLQSELENITLKKKNKRLSDVLDGIGQNYDWCDCGAAMTAREALEADK